MYGEMLTERKYFGACYIDDYVYIVGNNHFFITDNIFLFKIFIFYRSNREFFCVYSLLTTLCVHYIYIYIYIKSC